MKKHKFTMRWKYFKAFGSLIKQREIPHKGLRRWLCRKLENLQLLDVENNSCPLEILLKMPVTTMALHRWIEHASLHSLLHPVLWKYLWNSLFFKNPTQQVRDEELKFATRWKIVEDPLASIFFFQTTSILILIDTSWFKLGFQCTHTWKSRCFEFEKN